MSEDKSAGIGKVVWRDLTVPNAEEVRDFYCDVVGWNSTPHDMGEYDDYNIHLPATDDVVAGVCHARGANSKIPPQWLIYITVLDVEESARRCVARGGEVLDGPRLMGKSPFCLIRDPAGAVAALIEA